MWSEINAEFEIDFQLKTWNRCLYSTNQHRQTYGYYIIFYYKVSIYYKILANH